MNEVWVIEVCIKRRWAVYAVRHSEAIAATDVGKLKAANRLHAFRYRRYVPQEEQ